jgi:hypothetical protein
VSVPDAETRTRLRRIANEAKRRNAELFVLPSELLALLDALEEAERRAEDIENAAAARIADWLVAAEKSHYDRFPDAPITWGDASEWVRDGSWRVSPVVDAAAGGGAGPGEEPTREADGSVTEWPRRPDEGTERLAHGDD